MLGSRSLRWLTLLFATLPIACAPEADTADVDGSTGQETAAVDPTPAEGFDIHVMAPHVVHGKVMGPYHHYCKVISPEPVIQCILFESTGADAPMTEVEYIVAKSLTRNLIDREQWNEAWHDHAIEIASGRVQVIGMSDEDAQGVVDVVKKTDGLIFHMWPPGSDIPTGDVSIAQAVSHVALSAEEWEAHKAALSTAAE